MRKFVWLAVLVGLGCGPTPSPATPWSTVFSALPGALISVAGTSAHDVWSVGGDPGDGSGPMVLHFDGMGWKKLKAPMKGDLWWVDVFPNGPVFMGGANGTILKYENGAFAPMLTPPEVTTVFGIWGSSPTDVWAVGGDGNSHGFAWHFNGSTWTIPGGLPADIARTNTLYKVWGLAANDVWFVGSNTRAMHYDGTTFTDTITSTTPGMLQNSETPLFTVHGSHGHLAAVGGYAGGVALENNGSGWSDKSPKSTFRLSGVYLAGDGGYAVGGQSAHGIVVRRSATGWSTEALGITLQDSLHAVWIDPDGGVWAVGGHIDDVPLVHGVMIHKGGSVPGGTFTE
jgi:hypothetical protein